MLRSFAFAAAVAVALAAAPACAQVNWNLPSAYPADNFHSENLAAFAKDLAEATGGKLAIKVYPNASLFPATAIKSAVRIGQAQMGEILISLHDNEDPIFGDRRRAVSGRELRRGAQAVGGVEAGDRAQVRGARVDGAVRACRGRRKASTPRRRSTRIADMKGLSWRVYNAGTQRIAEIVGAYPVTIQAADLRQALATGLINAFMTSSRDRLRHQGVGDHELFLRHAGLDPEERHLREQGGVRPARQADAGARVLRAAAAAEARGWWRSQDRTKWYTEQLAANGLKVLPPSTALEGGTAADRRAAHRRVAAEGRRRRPGRDRRLSQATCERTARRIRRGSQNWRGPGGFPPSPLERISRPVSRVL